MIRCTLMLAVILCGVSQLDAQSGPPNPDRELRVPLGESFCPGMIFPVDYEPDRLRAELASLKEKGFGAITIPARHTDVPAPGSVLRKRIDAVLDWCDANDMVVFLELVIQYRSASEIGDIEKGYVDAVGYVRPHVEQWADVLKGHPCVWGVGLGNEVGPGWPKAGTEKDVPNYLAGWRQWLLERHGDLASLNAAWGTDYRDINEVNFPNRTIELQWVGPPDRQVFVVQPTDDPGFVDLRRFSKLQFGRFYSDIFDHLFRPTLGEIGYACETISDPYLYRAYPGASMLGWDIVVANYPPWLLKVFVDTDPRPAFNTEFHVYHNAVEHWRWTGGRWQGISAELTRYRYLVDALSGQWVNSMFMFRDFTNPDVAAVHAQTPATLAQIRRLEPLLRRLNVSMRQSRIGVLATEPMWHFSRYDHWHYSPPLERAYAALAATGRPWRFVLDIDLADEADRLDTLVAFAHDKIPVKAVEAIAALPDTVTVHWLGPWPTRTEYGQPLPETAAKALVQRCRQHAYADQLVDVLADPQLPSFYRTRVQIPHRWWNPDKDWIASRVVNVQVEARRATDESGNSLVVLINHTGDSVTLPTETPLPWLDAETMRAVDITDQTPRPITAPVTLGEFDVRLYRYMPRSD